ncbi:hypothetical protein [Pseudomonas putida]|uniref:hypothetical protein n=1 Tax=Pseudomonas putida TaxID=303 RepID=UPI001F525569|nr:hypothetical protein [Pseudomonas putida]MCI1037717.1 hypothetical protein [Pseudomonas putida]
MVETLKDNASWDYIATLSEQLTWFISQTVSLSRPDDGTDFFGSHRDSIRKVLEAEDYDLEDLEIAHYLCAKFLRELSYGSPYDYGKSDIILFYLFPKFEEINYKYADDIRFGVPARKTLEPEQNKINKVSAMFKKVEEWEKSLDGWQKRVQLSEDRFQGVVNANNYLSLGKAFDNLLTDKRRERNSLRRNLTLVVVSHSLSHSSM